MDKENLPFKVDMAEELRWRRVLTLSRAERRIYKDLLKTLSQEEIAQKHDIKKKTVKFHLNNIYQKLGIEDKGKAYVPKYLLFLREYCEVKPKRGCAI